MVSAGAAVVTCYCGLNIQKSMSQDINYLPSLTSRSDAGRMTEWDLWFRRHTKACAAVILAFGFLARVWAATGTFLNPDEAQHFLVANRSSLALAYKSSLTLAHPPLLIIALYYWRSVFGNSEFSIRMLSVLAGILFCWVFFKWMTGLLGDRTALVSLIFVSLLPPLVFLSAQVRQYSLLLLFLAMAGYFFEASLANNSLLQMLLFSLSLYLAMLSHYSAFFFAAAMGIYALSRFIYQRFPPQMITGWAVGQIGGLALFAFLYLSHISKLKGSSLAGEATEGWLRRSYFHIGQDSFLLFILGRTFGVFQFIFGNLAVGDVMGLCFFAGMLFLLKHRNAETKTAPTGRHLAILFTLPFSLNCAAALLGAYPYGGTRHSAFLEIFGAAGVAIFLLGIFRRNRARAVAIAIVIVGVCTIFGKLHQPYMKRADQSPVQMETSVAFIHQQIPRSVPILIDVQTRMLLGYYLCRQQRDSPESPHQDLEVIECGGYQLITANLWRFDAVTFHKYWDEMIRTYGFKPGDSVWVIQEGWDVGIPQLYDPKPFATFPEFRNLRVTSFGRNIQLFKVTVGDPLSTSSSSSGRPEAVARGM
jgi:hypothetical protein